MNGPPRPGVLFAALLAAVGWAYAPILAGGFVWDDRPLILEEPLVHELHPLSYLSNAFWRASASELADACYYRPLTTLSYALDWRLSGGHPALFHLTNLILHLGVCALVFALSRRAGAGAVAAALAAGVFGLSPRLAESAGWISGRTDLLAALCALGALLLHRSEPRRQGTRWAAAALLLAGMLAKEVAIAGFAALAILEWSSSRRGERRRAAANLLPAATALLAYAALRAHASRALPPPHDQAALSTSLRVASAFQALGHYLAMLLDPLRPRLRIGVLGGLEPGYLAMGLLVAAGLTALAWRRSRSGGAPWPATLSALCLSALVPVLHLVPIQVDVVAADRFLYLPLAALAAALAAASAGWRATTRRVAGALALLALPVLGIATFARNQVWSDEQRLWRAAAQAAPPGDAVPANELGNVLYRADRLEQALEWYRRAARTPGPLQVVALGNLASTRSELGDYTGAEELVRQLLTREPDAPIHHFNLGVILARQLRFGESERELARALAFLPDYPQAARALEGVRQARSGFAALPPEAAGEPPGLTARRAALYERLGAARDALPRWWTVVRSPSSAPADLRAAAVFLARRGAPPQAREALDRYRLAGAPAAELDGLEQLLADRSAGAP